jgi:hypothetical protein
LIELLAGGIVRADDPDDHPRVFRWLDKSLNLGCDRREFLNFSLPERPELVGPISRCSISLPSPPNDVGFNLTVGPDAAPRPINPTTGKRKHVGAIVIFTKQFHQFPGWRFAN